jgi:hypothetical protein
MVGGNDLEGLLEHVARPPIAYYDLVSARGKPHGGGIKLWRGKAFLARSLGDGKYDHVNETTPNQYSNLTPRRFDGRFLSRTIHRLRRVTRVINCVAVIEAFPHQWRTLP